MVELREHSISTSIIIDCPITFVLHLRVCVCAGVF